MGLSQGGCRGAMAGLLAGLAVAAWADDGCAGQAVKADGLGSSGYKLDWSCKGGAASAQVALDADGSIELVRLGADKLGFGDVRLRCETLDGKPARFRVAPTEGKVPWQVQLDDAACAWQGEQFACKTRGQPSLFCVAETRQLRTASVAKPHATVVLRSAWVSDDEARLRDWLAEQNIVFRYCAAAQAQPELPFVKLSFSVDGKIAVAPGKAAQGLPAAEAVPGCIAQRLAKRDPPYPQEADVVILWRIPADGAE
ncbi:hypothetical protein [Chitinimonas koreensis]|uniref:hypothetical protein n=1 Tax=Chitinimonas koreensis TaxID=356302 RepID=UPI0012FAC921|nr:hypothetical protein [Chitinimonas koreensis]QNM98583.1 hypothetical protein H9L41_10370 [Chitinimonas koreensis]